MKPTNTIFILSDEHNKRIMGSSGHPMIKTPHLDALAQRGTRFTHAYTNCPICVPSRASFATGRYVHEHRYWDNAIAYDGKIPSWGHRLMAQGHRVTSIGKLHYLSGDTARNGFDEEILPMHIVEGVGDLLGLIRDELPRRKGAANLGPEAGPGESEYTRDDRAIADETVKWLTNEAVKYSHKPWALYVGFVAPHFPLIAPPEYYNLYPVDQVPFPDMYAKDQRPRHPFTDAMRLSMCYDEAFDTSMVRRAIAAYFGLVTFMDHNVGRILSALESLGLMDNTRVVYTSDHGDNLGTRGMWGKSTMYEESAGIPMIIAGPDVPQGMVCETPVSLVDAFPTYLQSMGVDAQPEDADLPGVSLIDIANGFAPLRTVLSEYHAAASITGTSMILRAQYKYIHYVGLPPMLFNLDADPFERQDLGRDPQYAKVIVECEAALRRVVNPDQANANAKADQTALIEKHGGKDAILGKGTFRYSPPPGVKAGYH